MERSKHLTEGKFEDLDVIKIRWQCAPPPLGLGQSKRMVARAWGVSFETIRKIVAKETYRWVEDKLPEPVMPQGFDDVVMQSMSNEGSMDEAWNKLVEFQEGLKTGKQPRQQKEALSPIMEEARKKIERQAAIYRGQAVPLPEPEPDPDPGAMPCGFDPTGAGFGCIYPKGHEGDHST